MFRASGKCHTVFRFRKAKKVPVAPIPFNPWITPPIGAAGAAWDQYDYLPRDPFMDLQEDAARKQKERDGRSKGPINRGQYIRKRPMHRLTMAAWLFAFCALTSTGPAAWLKPILAVVAVFCGEGAAYLIKTRHLEMSGAKAAKCASYFASLILTDAALRYYGIDALDWLIMHFPQL
ncbi:hypothetical protein BH09SUM1_BH09SUM1_21820 [soil metagenome]